MNEIYDIAYQLILHAGDSKCHSMNAIKAARKALFEEFENYIRKAQKELTNAHHIQTQIIQK